MLIKYLIEYLDTKSVLLDVGEGMTRLTNSIFVVVVVYPN